MRVTRAQFYGIKERPKAPPRARRKHFGQWMDRAREIVAGPLGDLFCRRQIGGRQSRSAVQRSLVVHSGLERRPLRRVDRLVRACLTGRAVGRGGTCPDPSGPARMPARPLNRAINQRPHHRPSGSMAADRPAWPARYCSCVKNRSARGSPVVLICHGVNRAPFLRCAGTRSAVSSERSPGHGHGT